MLGGHSGRESQTGEKEGEKQRERDRADLWGEAERSSVQLETPIPSPTATKQLNGVIRQLVIFASDYFIYLSLGKKK